MRPSLWHVYLKTWDIDLLSSFSGRGRCGLRRGRHGPQFQGSCGGPVGQSSCPESPVGRDVISPDWTSGSRQPRGSERLQESHLITIRSSTGGTVGSHSPLMAEKPHLSHSHSQTSRLDAGEGGGEGSRGKEGYPEKGGEVDAEEEDAERGSGGGEARGAGDAKGEAVTYVRTSRSFSEWHLRIKGMPLARSALTNLHYSLRTYVVPLPL